MSNRHQRRASVAEFKREVAHGAHLDTYLVEADAKLDHQPLLRDARAYWWRGVATRKPYCISCKRSFTDSATRPGMFLLAVPSTAPTACSVSGICDRCLNDLTPDEIDRVATRVLQRVMPGARFLDPATIAMKPVRAIDVANAVPLDDRRGHRTPETTARIAERDRLLRQAADRYCVGMSGRQAARFLHVALSRYRECRWQRDRSEALCPIQHRGKLTALLFQLLRVHDATPSAPSIRRALGAIREPPDRV